MPQPRMALPTTALQGRKGAVGGKNPVGAKGAAPPSYKGGMAAAANVRKGPSPGQKAGKMAALSGECAEWTNYLSELILDLNSPDEELYSTWDKVLDIRQELLQLHGMGSALGGKGPVQTALGEAPAGAEKVDWKGKLQQLYAKRFNTAVEKGTIVYTCEDIPGQGFMAAVSADLFREGTYHGDPMSTKKLAEQAAAHIAVLEEFGDEASPPSYPPQAGRPTASPAVGAKRKRAEAAEPVPPKSRLHNSMHLLLGRNATKEDVGYETVQLEDGNYVSTLSLPGYDAGCVYQGAPGQNKKDAEQNAAEVANQQLQEVVAPLEEEHKAKKARINREKLDSLKKRKQEEVKDEAQVADH